MKILLLAVVVATALSQITPSEYAINLDMAPQYRYTALTRDKKQSILSFLDLLRSDDLYTSAFAFSHYLRSNLTTLVDPEFYQECVGIADELDRPVSELVVFNYMYELGAFTDFCTSVVMVDKDGHTVLGRNLDYGFQKYLSNSSVTLIYYKNGREVFRTAGHAGFIGTHTVMRKNSYALTLNERVEGGLRTTLEHMLRGCQQVPWLMRKTAQNCEDVQCAVASLSQGVICAPVYFIVASQTVNVVLERSREGVAASYNLLSLANSFIVQTNTDRGKPDPDGRRTTAEYRLAASPSLDEEALKKVLLQSPNFNNLTLLTVLMSPSQDHFSSVVWLPQ